MSRRALLLNRFVLVPLLLGVAIVAWNVYVSLHNDGRLAGRVVGPDGRPVPEATVIMYVQNVATFAERRRVQTDAEGRFAIADNGSHHLQLAAEKPGVGRSERQTVRLWFRAQNSELEQPLVLRP